MLLWPLKVPSYAIFRPVDFYDRTVEKIQIIKGRKIAVRTTLITVFVNLDLGNSFLEEFERKQMAKHELQNLNFGLKYLEKEAKIDSCPYYLN